MELPTSSIRPEAFDLCLSNSFSRSGDILAATTGVFQRAAVLRDGSGMVFEVTKDLSLRPDLTPEPPEKGIFFVRADGTGRRRLRGDASRVRTFASRGGVPSSLTELFFAVSPDGRTIAFSDLGPDQETAQIFTLDIATGRRRQLTHLPATPAVLSCLTFLDNRTLTFCTRLYTAALGFFLITDVFTVRDGRPEEKVPVVALDGGVVVPVFTIFGSRTRAAVTVVFFPATPVDRLALLAGSRFIEEVFLLDGKNVLQLTDFRRSDTARAGRGGAVAGNRVFFEASANPFGTNPGENCQVFSINTRGGDLRQLTRLRDVGHPSFVECFTANPASCSIERISAEHLIGAVAFTSSCDPVGKNPHGYQAFSMRPDGSRLRQLTSARGVETDPDGRVHVELPGPFYFQ